jgi:hypothetical protein
LFYFYAAAARIFYIHVTISRSSVYSRREHIDTAYAYILAGLRFDIRPNIYYSRFAELIDVAITFIFHYRRYEIISHLFPFDADGAALRCATLIFTFHLRFAAALARRLHLLQAKEALTPLRQSAWLALY